MRNKYIAYGFSELHLYIQQLEF